MATSKTPNTYAGQAQLYKEILFTEQDVDSRIAEMADDIVQQYRNDKPLFVGLLNGALIFTTKLMSAIQNSDPYFNPNVQFMIVSRYGPNREPGLVRLVTDLPPDYRQLNGQHVIILDDLLDGGGTTDFAEQHLHECGAGEVERIVLVRKRKEPPTNVKLAMFGFEAPDKWLTGMGMDDERLGTEANRWAGWIAVAN